MPSPRARRWLAAAAGVVVLVVVAAVVVVLLRAPHNVSHPDLSFTQPTTTAKTTPAPPAHKNAPYNFNWPRYGYDAARTRDFNTDATLKPPFRLGWVFGGNALLEFPPVIHDYSLYFLDDGATAKAVNIKTGKQIWKTHVGTLSAASPALGLTQGLLYMPILSDHGSTPGDGEIAALSMKTGRIVWTHQLPDGSESSPIVYRNTVYFGDQSGTMYSLNATTGHVNWTYHAEGAVKGGPALSGGLLYFADYAGRVYAINAHTGHQVWAVSTEGSDFGFGSGTFYSTPAVAFGRVYLGNTDGYVYSFAAKTGQLAWSVSTGAYVYASAAVADPAGLGPTVFIGSYTGDFYALNAQSGARRWVHDDGAKISGSATVVNNVVYYADFNHHTTGLNVLNGKTVFTWKDGAYSPVVADPTHIYLAGYNTLYELIPTDEPKSTSTATTAATTNKVKKGSKASHRAAAKARAHHADTHRRSRVRKKKR
jgi:outer membrane protein assembly factor BamB